MGKKLEHIKASRKKKKENKEDFDKQQLIELNKRLARINAEAAELMAELEEKNENLKRVNLELSKANAHAAELMAINELKEEEIKKLNQAIAKANARAASLIADEELRLEEVKRLNQKLQREINEKIEAQEQLRKEVAKFSAMINGMDEGVVLLDIQENISEVNPYFCHFFKCEKNSLIAKPFHILENKLPVYELLKEIQKIKKEKKNTITTIQKPIDNYEFLIRLQPIFRKDIYEGIIINLLDVTELVKAKREALKASKAKSEFLAHMSHEIRTPLNGIIGIANMLKHTPLNKEQKEYLEIIELSGDSLLTIINDILDFSKIEAGQLEFEQIDFNLHKEIKGIIKMLGVKADGKGIYLKENIEETVPEWVNGDPVRLKQVIINLVNNAIKFTEKGGVTLSVSHLKTTNKYHHLLFKVIDTGIGISEEGKKKLFKSYSQTEASTTRKYGGTGLGLAISRNLVKMMRGEIGVESELGKGTTFWFTVRLNKSQPKPATSNKSGSLKNIEFHKKLKILLVEDNDINRKVAIYNLQKEGHTVDSAINGMQAIEKVKLNDYDLIFMDVHMPIVDGLEATRQIRTLTGKYNIPIIAMTASTTKEEKDKVFDAGMDDFISKPFKPEQLREILEKYSS